MGQLFTISSLHFFHDVEEMQRIVTDIPGNLYHLRGEMQKFQSTTEDSAILLLRRCWSG